MIENSATILGLTQPVNPLARILTRTPSHAPPFLSLADKTGVGGFIE